MSIGSVSKVDHTSQAAGEQAPFCAKLGLTARVTCAAALLLVSLAAYPDSQPSYRNLKFGNLELSGLRLSLLETHPVQSNVPGVVSVRLAFSGGQFSIYDKTDNRQTVFSGRILQGEIEGRFSGPAQAAEFVDIGRGHLRLVMAETSGTLPTLFGTHPTLSGIVVVRNSTRFKFNHADASGDDSGTFNFLANSMGLPGAKLRIANSDSIGASLRSSGPVEFTLNLKDSSIQMGQATFSARSVRTPSLTLQELRVSNHSIKYQEVRLRTITVATRPNRITVDVRDIRIETPTVVLMSSPATPVMPLDEVRIRRMTAAGQPASDSLTLPDPTISGLQCSVSPITLVDLLNDTSRRDELIPMLDGHVEYVKASALRDFYSTLADAQDHENRVYVVYLHHENQVIQSVRKRQIELAKERAEKYDVAGYLPSDVEIVIEETAGAVGGSIGGRIAAKATEKVMGRVAASKGAQMVQKMFQYAESKVSQRAISPALKLAGWGVNVVWDQVPYWVTPEKLAGGVANEATGALIEKGTEILATNPYAASPPRSATLDWSRRWTPGDGASDWTGSAAVPDPRDALTPENIQRQIDHHEVAVRKMKELSAGRPGPPIQGAANAGTRVNIVGARADRAQLSEDTAMWQTFRANELSQLNKAIDERESERAKQIADIKKNNNASNQEAEATAKQIRSQITQLNVPLPSGGGTLPGSGAASGVAGTTAKGGTRPGSGGSGSPSLPSGPGPGNGGHSITCPSLDCFITHVPVHP